MSALQSTNEAKQQLFLEAFAKKGTIRGAIRAVTEAYERGEVPMQLSRTIVYQWKKENYLGFADKLEQAQHDFREYLEDLALKYVEGIKPGQNPLLLVTLLNANYPEKYRPKVVVQDDTTILGLLQELRSLGASTRQDSLASDTQQSGEGQQPSPREQQVEHIDALVLKKRLRRVLG